MGQYYFPTSVDKKENVYSHDYNNGLKLMEHSYLNNNFVQVVENLLAEGCRWYKNRFVWAGDYADVEEGTDENLVDICKTIKPDFKKLKEYRYILNHDKEEYIDKEAVQEFEVDWKIHPLPLLTCEGNGRGGGDFSGKDKRVGTWARDRISMSNKRPKDFEEVDGTFIE